ncbi:MAG: FtsH protease activity modulator HflK [Pseudomonadota bacterium]
MAWNDPDGNGRDPWGNRPGDQGPPDLDEVVRKMQQRLGGLFGSKPSSSDGGNKENRFVFAVIGIALLVLVVYQMIWRIDEQERGLVMRFGAYVATLQPGLNVRLPWPIEEVTKVNVTRIQDLRSKSSMLSGDENIIDVELAIQYRIKSPEDYLFKISDPEQSVQKVTESAIRDIIGQSTLDFVLTEGRAKIADDARILIQQMMDDYSSGVEITSVNMKAAKPPEEVKAAFDDAIKAREDEQRKINEAEAYRNEVVERAQGEASRILLEAEAYKERIMAHAEGEARRFNQLLVEYERAPEVTRRRLFLETMESVLSNSSKVVVDQDKGNSLMYLPIDKLISGDRGAAGGLRDSLPELRQQFGGSSGSSSDPTSGRLRGNR